MSRRGEQAGASKQGRASRGEQAGASKQGRQVGSCSRLSVPRRAARRTTCMVGLTGSVAIGLNL